MNQSFFIGALGAHQQQKSLNVTSSNIANVNTQGFKGAEGRFTALMYDNLRAIEEDTVESGVGTAVWTTDTNFAPGGTADTGRPQDYMIEGDGFFALENMVTGEISYTRAGSFVWASRMEETGEVDENGQPVTAQVFYLTDGEGRFVLDYNWNHIPMGEDRDAKQPIGIFDFANYNGMDHEDGTRFLSVDKNGGVYRIDGNGSPLAVDANGQVIPPEGTEDYRQWMAEISGSKLRQGMLEMSNVDLAKEMVDVIEAQRAYSMALKMMTTSDEIETTINNLRG